MSTLYLPTSIARNTELSAVQSKTLKPPPARLMLLPAPSWIEKKCWSVVGARLLSILFLFSKSIGYVSILKRQSKGAGMDCYKGLFIRSRKFARGAFASCSPASQSALLSSSPQPPAPSPPLPLLLLLNILLHTGHLKCNAANL